MKISVMVEVVEILHHFPVVTLVASTQHGHLYDTNQVAISSKATGQLKIGIIQVHYITSLEHNTENVSCIFIY